MFKLSLDTVLFYYQEIYHSHSQGNRAGFQFLYIFSGQEFLILGYGGTHL
jgi:hypothetical protein